MNFNFKSFVTLTSLIWLSVLFSCNKSSEKKVIEPKPLPKVSLENIKMQDIAPEDNSNEMNDEKYVILESLPDWVNSTEVISDYKIKNKYSLDPRLNPFYLEEDFNGDGILDIALPIKEIISKKVGFAIIHGGKNEVFIVGAGKTIKNGLDDDPSYIDVWKLNREKENTGTDTDEQGDLIETAPVFINQPSIHILKTELGGGLIFWNGKEYEYLHQTC